MKRHTPALTAEAIFTAASRKTAKIQRQLMAAQAELQIASAALIEALPAGAVAHVKSALAHNISAEEKVHAAVQELEDVKELLREAEPRVVSTGRRGAPRPHQKPLAGNSGEGARSLIPHLRKIVG